MGMGTDCKTFHNLTIDLNIIIMNIDKEENMLIISGKKKFLTDTKRKGEVCTIQHDPFDLPSV